MFPCTCDSPWPLISATNMTSLPARAYILLRRKGHAIDNHRNFSVSLLIFNTEISACARANLGYVAIFSNAEKFRCLYSHYGSCMPSSPKELLLIIYSGLFSRKKTAFKSYPTNASTKPFCLNKHEVHS